MADGGDEDIGALLSRLGFGAPEAAAAARATLEEAGLTRPGKKRISGGKLAAVEAALAATLVRACARERCRAEAGRSGRKVVPAARPTDCELCGGSQNRADVERAVAACRARGVRRIVVVGGSPSVHDELRALVGERLDLRLVDGTANRNAAAARADLAWADRVVIWGSTELDHKVSNLYTAGDRRKVLVCPRRGISALAQTLADGS